MDVYQHEKQRFPGRRITLSCRISGLGIVDQGVTLDPEVERELPDITLYDEEEQHIYIFEMMCPYGETTTREGSSGHTLLDAYRMKKQKYEGLREEVETKFKWRCTTHIVIVSSLGVIPEETRKELTQVFGKEWTHTLLEACSIDAIAGSAVILTGKSPLEFGLHPRIEPPQFRAHGGSTEETRREAIDRVEHEASLARERDNGETQEQQTQEQAPERAPAQAQDEHTQTREQEENENTMTQERGQEQEQEREEEQAPEYEQEQDQEHVQEHDHGRTINEREQQEVQDEQVQIQTRTQSQTTNRQTQQFQQNNPQSTHTTQQHPQRFTFRLNQSQIRNHRNHQNPQNQQNRRNPFRSTLTTLQHTQRQPQNLNQRQTARNQRLPKRNATQRTTNNQERAEDGMERPSEATQGSQVAFNENLHFE